MATKGVVIQITGDGASAAKALEMVDAHLKQTAEEAKSSGSSISSALGGIQNALGTLGISVGIGAAISELKQMISTSVDLGVEIGHLSQKTGIGTETLSGLKYVSDVTGVSFESLQRASKKLSTEMLDAEEGKKAAIQSFGLLGISVEQVRAHSNDLYGMLEILADKFQTMPDGPQKLAIATQLLGKTGLDLIPILDQGSAGLAKFKAEAESLGLVLDAAGIAKLEAMHAAEVKLDGATQGLALSLTSALSPALTDMASAAEKGIEKLRQLMVASGNAGMENFSSYRTVKTATDYKQYVPQSVTAISESNLVPTAMAAQKAADAAQAQAVALDAKHSKGLVSKKEYEKQKLAVQQEYYSQSQAAAAAYYLREQSLHDAALKSGNEADRATYHTMMLRHGAVMEHDTEMLAQLAPKAPALNISGDDDGGKGTAAVQAAAVPIDKSVAALVAARQKAAIDALHQMQELAREAPPAAVDVSSMAGIEKQKQQDAALAALDLKRTAMQRESGLVETQVQQQALAGTLSQQAALKDLDAEHAAEIVRLQALAAEYAAFGDAGRAAYAEIEEEITREMEAEKKEDKKSSGVEAAKQLGDGMTSMAEKMARATGTGREGFHKMCMSMEQDLVELAAKFAINAFLKPFMTGLGAGMSGGGGGGGVGGGGDGTDLAALIGNGHAGGGDMNSPGIVGEEGPELFFPEGPGTVMPNDALQNLSKSSGGGGAPSMTMNVTNASSQPVTARQTGSSFDADTRSYMTHVILEDLSQNGPISTAMRAGA
jgi:hypothetical protein